MVVTRMRPAKFGLPLTSILGATAYVVANDADSRIKASALRAKALLGDLVQICDGTADDVEIQAAIDALPAGGGKVVLSEGTFDISSAVSITSSNVAIVGQGGGKHGEDGATVVRLAATNDIFQLTGALGNHIANIFFRDLTIRNYSDSRDYDGIGIKAQYVTNLIVERVHFRALTEEAIWADTVYDPKVLASDFSYNGSTTNSKATIQLNSCTDSDISHSTFGGDFYINISSDANTVAVRILSNYMEGTSGTTRPSDYFIELAGNRNKVIGNWIQGNDTTPTSAIRISGSDSRVIGNGIRFSSTATNLIWVTTRNIVTENYVYGGDNGITAGSNSILANNFTSNQNNIGIVPAINSQVIGNQIINAGNYGIYLYNDTGVTVEANYSTGSTTAGLREHSNCGKNFVRNNNFDSYDFDDLATTGSEVSGNDGFVGIGETRTFRKTVNYNDTSPVTVCDVEDGYMVEAVYVEVVTTFDDTGPQTLDIGDGLDVDRFLTNAEIDPSTTGYQGSMSVGYVYTSSDTIDATIGAGNADGTQGQAIVYVKILRIGG